MMKNNIFKTGALLAILVTLTKLTGFFRETIIVSTYGASSTTDAYFVAFSIINILFMTFGAAIGTIIIPSYTRLKSEANKKEIYRYLQSFMGFFFFVSIVVSLLGMTYSQDIVNTFFPDLENVELTAQLLQILFPTLFLMTLNLFYSSILNVNKIFLPVNAALFLGNLIVIISILLLTNKLSIYAILLGQILSLLLQYVLLFITVKRLKIEFGKNVLKINFKVIKSDLREMLPIVFVALVLQGNMFIERYLASTLAAGSITKIGLAFRITDFLISILITVFGTILYPNFAELFVKKDSIGLVTMVKKSLRIIILITFPLVGGLYLYSYQAVDLLVGYGNFTKEDVNYTSEMLMFYSLTIPLLSVSSILMRFLYAIKKSKSILYIQLIYTVGNISIGLLLLYYLKDIGIPIAFVVASFINLILLTFVVIKNFPDINSRYSLIFLFKVFISTMIMMSIVNFINILIKEIYFELIIGIIVGFITYILCLVNFKINETKIVIKYIKEKSSNGVLTK